MTVKIPVRSVRFGFDDMHHPVWSRKPEFAISANAVSLLMPYAEPYVARSVRKVLPKVPQHLRGDARAYVRQEAQHFLQHRTFNAVIAGHYPGVSRIERWMDKSFSFIERRSSEQFNVAYAAGFETVAYCAARWVDRHADELFPGAEEGPASLFLWHLAEEVEHKGVAIDVYRSIGGTTFTYVLAMITSMLMLAWFSVLGVVAMLWSERRLFHPIAHFRMIKWSLSFLFGLLPAMAISALPGHHPNDLVDPVRLQGWINGRFDGFDDLGVNVPSSRP